MKTAHQNSLKPNWCQILVDLTWNDPLSTMIDSIIIIMTHSTWKSCKFYQIIVVYITVAIKVREKKHCTTSFVSDLLIQPSGLKQYRIQYEYSTILSFI